MCQYIAFKLTAVFLDKPTAETDILSPTVPEYLLGHILTPPGVKVKKDSNFEVYRFSRIAFELRKTSDLFKYHRVSLSKTHRNMYF